MTKRETSRRSFLTSVGVGVVGSAVGVGQSGAAAGRKELIVATDDGTPLSYLEEQVKTLYPDADLVDRDETLGFTLASVPTSQETQFKSDVSGLTRYVERNGRMTIGGTAAMGQSSDPRLADQWAPQEVNAGEAWNETQAESVTVAVVDTGVDYTHEDLTDRFGSTKGYDFVEDNDDPMDEHYHGTHVAGIAAGTTDNGTGIAGVSNAQLLGVRVLDENGGGSWSDVAQGIRWAADNGADVINLSLGPPGCTGGVSNTVADAIRYAHGEGSLVVAAAGNDSCTEIDGPARVDECVAVTALDQNGDIADFSNRGDRTDFIAPGVDVLSSYPGDSYRELSGTSMASPVVAGVAALALSSDSSLGPGALKRKLADGAVDIGLSDQKQGFGRVDAKNVVGGGGNDGPTARIDPDTTTPGVGESVRFDGSASSDPDGQIASHEWDFGDGTTAAGATVSHSYGAAGRYTVTLTVTDDAGATASDSVSITVDDPNDAPSAGIDAPSGPLVVGKPATFGSTASDPDGQVASHEWAFGDGTTAAGATVDHTYGAAGTYTVELTVTDDDGATDTATTTVTVEEQNDAPSAGIDAPSGPLVVGKQATFDSTASDPDGQVASHEWAFGDGTTASGSQVDHTYGSAGTYTVELTVTDDDGATDTASETVQVDPANDAPVAKANLYKLFWGGIHVLSARRSRDPDGRITDYEWELPDGSTKRGSLVFAQIRPGETVTLTVTDDDGATDSDEATTMR